MMVLPASRFIFMLDFGLHRYDGLMDNLGLIQGSERGGISGMGVRYVQDAAPFVYTTLVVGAVVWRKFTFAEP